MTRRDEPPTTTLCLDADRARCWRPRAPTTIGCVAGVVWVTVDGDPRDVVLGPGEAFDVRRRRPVVVTAMRGAAVTVTVHAHAAFDDDGWLRRLARWLRRDGHWGWGWRRRSDGTTEVARAQNPVARSGAWPGRRSQRRVARQRPGRRHRHRLRHRRAAPAPA